MTKTEEALRAAENALLVVAADCTPMCMKDVPECKQVQSALALIRAARAIQTGQMSDGYHTFDELYEHRITLWMALCRLVGGSWRTGLHSDGSKFEGWFVLGLGNSNGEQMTYHLPMDKWASCDFADTLGRAPDFDGHSSADVLDRVRGIRAARAESGWRPIESAPKDGTRVDLWTGNGRFTDCWFCDKRGEWRHWWVTEWGNMGACRLGEYVTHWQPLPAPPSAPEVK